MKELINHLVWMFGGICLIAVIVEFPYSIYQDTEFALTGRSIGFYLIFSTLYAVYKVYTSNKAKINQSAEPS